VSSQEHVPPEGLRDTTLPYLAYGSLRPGEPAHRRIGRWVESAQDVQVRGALLVRDGLPLLRYGGGDRIAGNLIKFKKEKQGEAYAAIQAFEPGRHYRWMQVEIAEERANVLVGLHITDEESTYSLFDETSWSSWRDPVFSHGLALVRSVVESAGVSRFASAPGDAFEWQRFFSLQMAYLLLWSAIERYCSLAYGSDLAPEKKVGRLAKDDLVRESLRLIERRDEVHDVRDPNVVWRLGTSPYDSLNYYRQVRNNLSHRGKGAWYDAEKVRLSLAEMTAVMETLISSGLNSERR